MKKFILGTIALSLLIVGITSILPNETRPQPANASDTAPFDHNNCQYPDRWSNPVNGCDNSDPAVPECIKSAFSKQSEQACIDAFVKSKELEVITPIDQPAIEPANPIECGGK